MNFLSVKKIFGIEAAYLSDESSLSDFTDARNDMDKVLERVKRAYGVDISRYKTRPLFKLVKMILRQKKN